MAEQFMTRRERREAEQRAAGAARAGGSEDPPAATSSTSAADVPAPHRSRRASAVTPPNAQGAREVTGAASLARAQAAIDAARRAERGETDSPSARRLGASKPPHILLGVAAVIAVALIIIALVIIF